MATDALSDVLRALRLAGALYFDVAARAPWVAEQPTREMVLPKILPGAQRLISYHVVTEGRCFAGLIDAEPTLVEAGEVVVFTKGDPHVAVEPSRHARQRRHDGCLRRAPRARFRSR